MKGRSSVQSPPANLGKLIHRAWWALGSCGQQAEEELELNKWELGNKHPVESRQGHSVQEVQKTQE